MNGQARQLSLKLSAVGNHHICCGLNLSLLRYAAYVTLL